VIGRGVILFNQNVNNALFLEIPGKFEFQLSCTGKIMWHGVPSPLKIKVCFPGLNVWRLAPVISRCSII